MAEFEYRIGQIWSNAYREVDKIALSKISRQTSTLSTTPSHINTTGLSTQQMADILHTMVKEFRAARSVPGQSSKKTATPEIAITKTATFI